MQRAKSLVSICGKCESLLPPATVMQVCNCLPEEFSMEIFLLKAGFNAGDGVRYFNIPHSRTSAIINISSTSNYQIPGMWIFQVDGETVKNTGCTSGGGIVC